MPQVGDCCSKESTSVGVSVRPSRGVQLFPQRHVERDTATDQNGLWGGQILRFLEHNGDSSQYHSSPPRLRHGLSRDNVLCPGVLPSSQVYKFSVSNHYLSLTTVLSTTSGLIGKSCSDCEVSVQGCLMQILLKHFSYSLEGRKCAPLRRHTRGVQRGSDANIGPLALESSCVFWAPTNISVRQGGRTWQSFAGSKEGNENFCQARIYNFRVKCVVFARNRKFAKLTQWNMQYIPCNSALLAQETMFLTQKGTFFAQRSPKSA